MSQPKKRGRKKVCNSYPNNNTELVPESDLFGGSTQTPDEGTISFGNMNIGVTKINNNVSPLVKKIASEHNLCEIVIPENIMSKISETETDTEKAMSGEYRVEEDYLLNMPKYTKKKKYKHYSTTPGEEVFPLFEALSELVHYPLEKKTNICCWWCCHRFDVTPRVFPTKYKNGVFYYTGNFCSWACVRAYTLKDKSICNRYKQNLLCMFLLRLYSPCNDTGERFSPDTGIAPPRQSLKMFGGDLTITEFREASKKFKYNKISQISGMLDRNIYLYRKAMD
jgi:hypothetical protein